MPSSRPSALRSWISNRATWSSCRRGRSASSCRSTRSDLAPTFEAHHVLDDGFALLSDCVLLRCLIRARFAELLALATGLHRHELVDFFATGLAYRHGGVSLD